ncbi:sugar transferase [Halochromatium sp.]
MVINRQETPDTLLDRIFNIAATLLLLFVSLPLFVILPILIKLDDPSGPVFYRGPRLGLGKKPFTIYKFRSLKPNAAAALGNDLVGQGHNVETRVGSFLRDTRLDELPQLFNVLRGEMNLVGPRPEREEVYEAACKSIPGYDLRFAVRPGVIGYSQLFTPHRTYKRLRSLIDYQFAIKKHSTINDLKLLIAALWMLCVRVFQKVFGIEGSRTQTHLTATVHHRCYPIVDCNEFVVIVRSDPKEICDQYEQLDVSILAGKKTIHFRGVCLQSSLDYYIDELDGLKRQKRNSVLLVEKLTPLNEYKFHKYVLRTSVG